MADGNTFLFILTIFNIMKKTIITLLALAGVAAADVIPTSVWSYDDYDLTQTGKIDLSSLGLSTAKGEDGYTLMMTFSSNVNFSGGAGSILWLSSIGANESGDYKKSTGTLGYRSNNSVHGLSTFNAAQGSSSTDLVEWHEGGISNEKPTSRFGPTTIFMTSQAVTDEATGVTKGVATLYELTQEGTLKLTSKNNGLLCAAVKSMWIGNWTMDGSNLDEGTADMALYSGVLTESQMNSLIVPEPTTATLSLLALAGLAVRRRRK